MFCERGKKIYCGLICRHFIQLRSFCCYKGLSVWGVLHKHTVMFYPPSPSLHRLAFGTLYPAYSSYKAVKTKNVKEYVSILPLVMYYICELWGHTITTITLALFVHIHECCGWGQSVQMHIFRSWGLKGSFPWSKNVLKHLATTITYSFHVFFQMWVTSCVWVQHPVLPPPILCAVVEK